MESKRNVNESEEKKRRVNEGNGSVKKREKRMKKRERIVNLIEGRVNEGKGSVKEREGGGEGKRVWDRKRRENGVNRRKCEGNMRKMKEKACRVKET